MKLRPATVVTSVVVTFAIAGIMRVSTRGMSTSPEVVDDAQWNDEVAEPDDVVFESSVDADAVDVGSELIDAESPSTDPTVDEQAWIDALRNVADRVDALSREGQQHFAELGDPFYDVDDPSIEGQRHIERWSDYSRDWETKVGQASSWMPSPPAWNASPEKIAAYQDVAEAIRHLRNASTGAQLIPLRNEWTAHFVEATRQLEQARETIAAMDR